MPSVYTKRQERDVLLSVRLCRCEPVQNNAWDNNASCPINTVNNKDMRNCHEILFSILRKPFYEEFSVLTT